MTSADAAQFVDAGSPSMSHAAPGRHPPRRPLPLRRTPRLLCAIAAVGNQMLIETKLQQPHLRDALVRRPRLLRTLDAATAGKQTEMTSPAGFGKSTLLSQWAAGISGGTAQVAWLSIDRLDSAL